MADPIEGVQGLIDIGTSLFGGKSKTSGSGTTKSSGKQTEQLVLDDDAIAKIIQDVLGGANGLASIFGGEQTAGIFNSSVAAQAAGDLASNLVGELAKITGKREVTQESTSEQTSNTTNKDGGLLGAIKGIF